MLDQTVIVGIVALVNIALGLSVFVRNIKLPANRTFLFLSTSVVLWMISSFFTDNAWSTYAKLQFGKSTYAFALLIVIMTLYFSTVFPKRRKLNVADIAVTVITLTGIILTIFTNSVVTSITLQSNGITAINPGNLYIIWVGCFAMAALLTTVNLLKQYKLSDSVGKSQVKLIILGIVCSLAIGSFTNVILPLTIPSAETVRFGPFATVPLVASIAYAIIKHKLFDIRLIIVRTLVYLLSIGILSSTYLFLVLGLAQLISLGPNLSVAQHVFYVLLSLLYALSLAPLKRVFNKITNKFFYTDAYDTQEVIDKIGTIIVGSIDPHKIQKEVLGVIEESLKPMYATFLLYTGTNIAQGYSVGQHWNIHNTNMLQSTLRRIGKKITIYDELEEENIKYQPILRQEDISVVAPLVTKEETIGYLLLGPKKSGNIYNSQDIGLLSIVTHELAVALQNAQRFEEIQAFNVTLQEKVSEATRELKSTNKKLIALDEAKDEFISMASHQLRTPLTSIKGYLSMLVEGDLGAMKPAQEKVLKEALGSSQRMVYLIADFLNVSRIKTGKFMIEPKEVYLPEIVHEEITQLREMAGSRDLTLEYDQPEEFPRVKLDDNKIRQVMMNMVDNAIYYTLPGGKIKIQLYATADEIIFKVVDNGIGVPKAEQHKLFTKFYRAGNARKSRPDGTGLGLFMAQKIVVEQGGAIIFESVEGKGSTFGFRFPLKKIAL